MISLRNIKKEYKTKDSAIQAVNNITLDFDDKGFCFLVGKSGCGKTTLLNILGLLDNDYLGEYSFNYTSLSKLNEKKKAIFRSNDIGYVFQDFQLIDSLNVFENISISLEIKNKKIDQTLVSEMLTKVGLSGYENKKINILSGGEKQRVAIARALIKGPRVLLCDEPTGALDHDTGLSIMRLLKDISKDILVICVSHDLDYAKEFGDRIITISDGRVENDTYRHDGFVSNEEPAKKTLNKIGEVKFKRFFKMMKSFYFKKPLRGIIAIFLGVFSVSLLGISHACSHIDRTGIIVSGIEKNELNTYGLKKQIVYTTGGSSNLEYINFSNDELSKIQSQLGKNVYPIYKFPKDVEIDNLVRSIKTDLFDSEISGYAEISSKLIEDCNYTFVGELPSEWNEIMITDYQYEYIKSSSISEVYDSDIIYNINTYNDIIGKSLKCNSDYFTITGIVNTNFNFARYNLLKSKVTFSNSLRDELDEQLQGSFHNVFFVSNAFRKYQLFGFSPIQNYNELKLKSLARSNNSYLAEYSSFSTKSTFDEKVIWLNGTNTLAEDEVILPINAFIDEGYYSILERGANVYGNLYYEEIKDSFIADNPIDNTKEDYIQYIINKGYRDNHYKIVTLSEIWEYGVKDIFNENIEFYKNKNISFTVELTKKSSVTFNAKLAAVVYNYDICFESNKSVFCNSEFLNSIINKTYGFYNDINSIIIPVDKDVSKTRRAIELLESSSQIGNNNPVITRYGVIIDEYEVENVLMNSSFYCYNNSEATFMVLVKVFSILSKISLVLLIGFVLYLNISIIGQYKNELMVIRALGENKVKLCLKMSLIFIIVTFVISLLSIGIGAGVITIFNIVQISSLNMIFSIFTYSLLSVIYVIGLNLLIGVCCSFIPLIIGISKPISASLKCKE